MGLQPESSTADGCFEPALELVGETPQQAVLAVVGGVLAADRARLGPLGVRVEARPHDRSAGVSAPRTGSTARLLRRDAEGVARPVQYGGVARRGPQDLTFGVLSAGATCAAACGVFSRHWSSCAWWARP
jgi:hypothetical protein